MSNPSTTGASQSLALLIPGLDGTGRFYDWHLGALSRRYRVLAWKFRPRATFGFHDLVEELAEGTLGESPRSITVVGESFGGPIAMHYVLAYPERVRSLVLINTFSYYGGQARIRLACFLAPLLRWWGFQGIKNFLADLLLAREGITPEGRRHYREIVAMIDMAAYCRRLELVRDTNLRGRLAAIEVPTLILASGRDKIVPSSREGRLMASHIAHARLHEFPRAGHALLLTPGFSLADYI